MAAAAAQSAAVRKVVQSGTRKVTETVKEVAGPRADSAAFVAREIGAGLFLGIIGGAIWKMYHVNYKRELGEFYDKLDNGEITTVIT